MVEQINILFGVNTLGGPWNIVLHRDPELLQRGGGKGGVLPIVDSLHTAGMAEDRDAYRMVEALTKTMQK